MKQRIPKNLYFIMNLYNKSCTQLERKTHLKITITLRLDVCIAALNWIWYSRTANSAVWVRTETSNGNEAEYSAVFALTRAPLPQYRPLRLRFRWICTHPQNIPLGPLSFPPRPEKENRGGAKKLQRHRVMLLCAWLLPHPGDVAATAAFLAAVASGSSP